MENKLKFSKGNAKISFIPSLNLSAGWSCPFADKCLTKVDMTSGKISEGPNNEFRCFSASQENLFPSVRKQREHNFNLLRKLKTVKEMADLIESSLPNIDKFNIIRIHVSGDFFNQTYFDAWMLVARRNPSALFYAYTKSLVFWIARLGQIPQNLSLTASWGGKFDPLIDKYNLRSVKVVKSVEEAESLNLPIDHDDSHAYATNDSFALLIHGTQRPGSEYGLAKNKLRRDGVEGYRREKVKIA